MAIGSFEIKFKITKQTALTEGYKTKLNASFLRKASIRLLLMNLNCFSKTTGMIYHTIDKRNSPSYYSLEIYPKEHLIASRTRTRTVIIVFLSSKEISHFVMSPI